MDIIFYIIIVVAALVAFALGFLLRKYLAEAKITSAENEAKKILEEAHKNAQGKSLHGRNGLEYGYLQF